MTIKTRRHRGVIFISLLAVTVVVAMLTAAFLKRSQSGLFRATHYRDGIRAEQAARGGANHVMAMLEADNGYNSPLTGNLNGAIYSVTFDPSQTSFSVNNLDNDAVATQVSFQGHQVAPRSADIIVVGSYGMSRRVIRVVVQQGVSSLRSVAAVGRVSLAGDVVVDGVKSLTPRPGQAMLDPAPGGILSKHRTDDVSQPAISWAGGASSFSLSELSRLETAPADTGIDSVSSNLRAQFPEKIIDQGASDTIPDIDVAARVSSGMSNAALAPGGSTLSGYVIVSDERSVAGDLTINGDLVLSEGTVFINGDLTINGGMEGMGAVYASGDITIRGGNTTIQPAQQSGPALMAAGDISLQGIDAEGYLDALALPGTPLDSAYGLFTTQFTLYANEDPGALWYRTVELAKHIGSGGQVWINPIPSPDGSFNLGTSTAAIPRLILRLQQDVPNFGTDDKAQKIVSALEEMQFAFRHNLHTVRARDGAMFRLDGSIETPMLRNSDNSLQVAGGYIPSVADMLPGPYLSSSWDDAGEPLTSWTHDHLNLAPEPIRRHQAKRTAYMLFNPLDLSWMGDSVVQGLVYARGNVFVDTRFKVVGSLISLGDVNLNNGSTLIYNEEYRDLFGQLLPIGVVHFEEL